MSCLWGVGWLPCICDLQCCSVPHVRLLLPTGTTVVVEEFLTGEEASFFAFIDGENCIPLVGAQVGGQAGTGCEWVGLHCMRSSGCGMAHDGSCCRQGAECP